VTVPTTTPYSDRQQRTCWRC